MKVIFWGLVVVGLLYLAYSGMIAALRIRDGLVVASCGAYSFKVAKSPVSATTLVNFLS